MKKYECFKKIAEGGEGNVYLAKGKEEEIIVIKKIYCDDIDKINQLTSEVNRIIKLKHKNVTEYIDSYVEVINENSLFCIAMPYYTIGDLKCYLKIKTLDEKELIDIFTQISDGIEYLHSKEIIHRDLKPENIFLMEDENKKMIIKIGDFGISSLITKSIYKTICGTLKNAAPEQFYEMSNNKAICKSFFLKRW
jgi:serine/threonine protein kinase